MATTAHNLVDLTPITSAIMQIVAALLLAFGTWAIQRLGQWVGLKNDSAITAAFDSALQKAVTFGLQQSHELIKQNGWDHVSVHDATLASAGTYIASRFPDTLKNAGLDPTAADFDKKVKDALDRAFPHAVAVAAASPATPPATAPNPPEQKDLPVQGVAQVNQNQG
jgi:hypothetical protein